MTLIDRVKKSKIISSILDRKYIHNKDSWAKRYFYTYKNKLKYWDDIIYSCWKHNEGFVGGGQEYILNSIYEYDRTRYLPRLVFSTSTICSLNCEYCAELIPHICNKRFLEYNTIKRDYDAIFRCVDMCPNIEIIGGEPFIHPDISRIIELFTNSSQINIVEITTNAVCRINDDVMQKLKNPKIRINISDYGHNHDRVMELIRLLDENNIWYQIWTSSEQFWVDSGGIKKRNKKVEQLEYEYQTCDAACLCRTVYDGKLYVCSRGIGIDDNNLLEDDSSYLDVERLNKMTEDEAWKELKQFWLREFASICDYCDYNTRPVKVLDSDIRGKQIERVYQMEDTTTSSL